MGSLFKQKVVRYIDPKNGKRVTKNWPGAKREEYETKKWYGEYTDENNVIQRVSLSTNKTDAQSMLAEKIAEARKRASGIEVSPYEKHFNRPLSAHIADYGEHLESKGNTEVHNRETITKITTVALGCGFKHVQNIDGAKVATWLNTQRKTRKRFSIQTSNYYLGALKSFCRWLDQNDRIPKNPLSSLRPQNADVDRRHERRSLSDDEFMRLVRAAECGRRVEGVDGEDRAMLYVLACWTGYRKKELASLTLSSFDFDARPAATVRLKPKDSKRRKRDSIPIHETVVERLRSWLEKKGKLSKTVPIFSLRSPGGGLRKTCKMMRVDLASARKTWIEEARTEEEREERKTSDFLSYQDQEGLFADFHANRHTFISNLGRMGVPIQTAQKLARHSDPKLTTNIYTHLDGTVKSAAISTLPAAPGFEQDEKRSLNTKSANGDYGLVTGMVTGNVVHESPPVSSDGYNEESRGTEYVPTNSLSGGELGTFCHVVSSEVPVRLAGFEPATYGLGIRCSIP